MSNYRDLAMAALAMAMMPEPTTTGNRNITSDLEPAPDREPQANLIAERMREERRRRKHNAWLKRQPLAAREQKGETPRG